MKGCGFKIRNRLIEHKTGSVAGEIRISYFQFQGQGSGIYTAIPRTHTKREASNHRTPRGDISNTKPPADDVDLICPRPNMRAVSRSGVSDTTRYGLNQRSLHSDHEDPTGDSGGKWPSNERVASLYGRTKNHRTARNGARVSSSTINNGSAYKESQSESGFPKG
jgi:hypothetical protein